MVSREYSAGWEHGEEPFYPGYDTKNAALYAWHRALVERELRVIFGGRLGEYSYYDMDAVIASALHAAETLLQGR